MENKQLDDYLVDMAQGLRGLTPLQREEEVREVRQHLEALVFSHLQMGKSQDEAVDLALRQFGQAEVVGLELNKAVVLQQRRRKIRTFTKYFCVWLGIAVVQFVIYSSMNDKPTDFPYTLDDRIILALTLASTGLCGQGLSRLMGEKRKAVS